MDMLATGVVRATRDATTPAQVMQLIARGEISVGIVIPPDVARRKANGAQVEHVLVVGSDAVEQSAAIQLAHVPEERLVANANAGRNSVGAVYHTQRADRQRG